MHEYDCKRVPSDLKVPPCDIKLIAGTSRENQLVHLHFIEGVPIGTVTRRYTMDIEDFKNLAIDILSKGPK